MLLSMLRAFVALFVPREDPPAGGASEADQLRALAEQLEASNKKIAELETAHANRQAEIHAEAEKLLLEVMPETENDLLLGRRVAREAARGDRASHRGDDDGDGDGGRRTEPTADERIAEVLARQQRLEDQMYAQELDVQLRAFQQEFPHMDRVRVQLFLERQGENAGRVNLRELCKISHNKELGRLQSYADQHFATKLEEMQKGGKPPETNLPPGSGSPTEVVKITRDNAPGILAERMAKLGFGRESAASST